MLDEVQEALAGIPAGPILDATVGGGGHAAALLVARPDCSLVGIDRDQSALEAAGRRLEAFGDRVSLAQASFSDLGAVLDGHGAGCLSAFLFDLGVSSPQLDRPERGFSYREAGPLDMRMDTSQGLTADEVVNGYGGQELERLLRQNADERFARRIAARIVEARPVRDTAQLAELVRSAIPAAARRRGGHPAKRTFQAIRMEVNGELQQIPMALDAAIDRLCRGGRGAVLSYHSGEDRLVKACFDQAVSGGCTCPPRLPCACGALSTAVPRPRRARRPQPDEVASNPRAASARLRTMERA